jgi:hypothetical protein
MTVPELVRTLRLRVEPRLRSLLASDVEVSIGIAGLARFAIDGSVARRKVRPSSAVGQARFRFASMPVRSLTNWQIMWRHVLPNSLTPVITFLPFRMSAAILSLTSLDTSASAR